MKPTDAIALTLTLLVISGLTISHAQTTSKTPKAATQKNSPEKLPFADARNMTVILLYAPPRAIPKPFGSGVWIGKKGYIATCHHVIGDRAGSYKIGLAIDTYISEHIVVTSSATVVEADFVASDPDTDLAIFKAHIPPDQLQQQSPVPFLGPGKPSASLTPQVPVTPMGAALSNDLPQLGESMLVAGFPLGENTLVLQTGVATGFLSRPTTERSLPPTGLRIMLSLVSNPGNSGGPVFDADGKVVGLLEGNLSSPIRDSQGRQVYSPILKLDANGQPMRDANGQPQFDIIPLQENSGISFAVPSRFIADLAEKNHIDLN